MGPFTREGLLDETARISERGGPSGSPFRASGAPTVPSRTPPPRAPGTFPSEVPPIGPGPFSPGPGDPGSRGRARCEGPTGTLLRPESGVSERPGPRVTAVQSRGSHRTSENPSESETCGGWGLPGPQSLWWHAEEGSPPSGTARRSWKSPPPTPPTGHTGRSAGPMGRFGYSRISRKPRGEKISNSGRPQCSRAPIQRAHPRPGGPRGQGVTPGQRRGVFGSYLENPSLNIPQTLIDRGARRGLSNEPAPEVQLARVPELRPLKVGGPIGRRSGRGRPRGPPPPWFERGPPWDLLTQI